MYDDPMVMGKDQRQQTVLQLLRGRPATTQAQLIKALRAKRIAVDQSTLSRDLTELGIRKSGGRYVVADHAADTPAGIDYAAAVQSFSTCGPHLIVIHTGTGQAQPVALAIEHDNEPAIVATLAGDDTIFIATKSRRGQTVALRRVKNWFGDKHER